MYGSRSSLPIECNELKETIQPKANAEAAVNQTRPKPSIERAIFAREIAAPDKGVTQSGARFSSRPAASTLWPAAARGG